MEKKVQVEYLDIGSYFLYNDKPVEVDNVDFDTKPNNNNLLFIVNNIFEGGTEMLSLNKNDFYESIDIYCKEYIV